MWLGVFHPSFACLSIWDQDVANVSLLAWAEMLWPTNLLAVVGPANPAALGIRLRQMYAIQRPLAASFAAASIALT